jgi:hypothetical protein
MSRSITLAALLLCAISAAAQAQQTADRVLTPDRALTEERALTERRQRMIDECEANHGSEVDCKREVDTELRAEGLQTGARVIRLGPPR